jgi:hypothetical protein
LFDEDGAMEEKMGNTNNNSSTTNTHVPTSMKRRIVQQHPPHEENENDKQQPVVVDSPKAKKRCQVNKDETQEHGKRWKERNYYRGFSLQSLQQVVVRKASSHHGNNSNKNTYPTEDADDNDDDEAIPPPSSPSSASRQPNFRLDVIDSETTATEFYHRYVALRKPCVVSGLPRRRRRRAPEILNHHHHHPTETANAGTSPDVTPTATKATKVPNSASPVVSLSCHDLVQYAGQEVRFNASPAHLAQYITV